MQSVTLVRKTGKRAAFERLSARTFVLQIKNPHEVHSEGGTLGKRSTPRFKGPLRVEEGRNGSEEEGGKGMMLTDGEKTCPLLLQIPGSCLAPSFLPFSPVSSIFVRQTLTLSKVEERRF